MVNDMRCDVCGTGHGGISQVIGQTTEWLSCNPQDSDWCHVMIYWATKAPEVVHGIRGFILMGK